MSSHLSHDQISRCVLGQAGLEEEKHARNCPQCREELRHFTETMATFQTVMKDWAEGEAFPRLQEAASPRLRWGWAAAGLAIAALAAVPIYRQGNLQPTPEPAPKSDETLMEEVAAHLSRPLPMSMERVMLLLPEVDQPNAPEREEVR